MIQRLREVWYGQRSLAETYWLWGILSSVVVYAIAFATLMLAQSTGKPAVAHALYFILTAPISVFQVVANWRSAGNHPGFWATVVRILVVLNVIVLLIYYVSLFAAGDALNPPSR